MIPARGLAARRSAPGLRMLRLIIHNLQERLPAAWVRQVDVGEGVQLER